MSENQAKVLAVVGDVEITENDLQNYIAQMDPQIAVQFQSEEGQGQILDELIRQELLFLDAKENKLDEEEDFVKVLEQTKENLLKSYAFSKLVEGFKIEEEEVEKFYNEIKDNLVVPATVEAAHILVDTEEKAKELKKELDEGADFGELAKANSSCPSKDNGGNLGRFQRGQMVPEFDEAVFSMEKGEISEPIKTEFGYHLINLIDTYPETTRSLEETRHELESELMRQKQQESYLAHIEELEKKYTVKKN